MLATDRLNILRFPQNFSCRTWLKFDSQRQLTKSFIATSNITRSYSSVLFTNSSLFHWWSVQFRWWLPTKLYFLQLLTRVSCEMTRLTVSFDRCCSCKIWYLMAGLRRAWLSLHRWAIPCQALPHPLLWSAATCSSALRPSGPLGKLHCLNKFRLMETCQHLQDEI